VIRGFDSRNKELARGRALNVAIKLRKLGVKDAIQLETQIGGTANKAEIYVN
jgi:outer membrane protein OmpA-like peptidoglycan-associated protein